MNLQNRKRLTDRKRTYVCRVEGTVREDGKAMYTLVYLKWRTSKDLLWGTGDCEQCSLAAWMGGGFGENGYTQMYG